MAFILEFAEANEETLLDSMLLNLLTTTPLPYWEDVDCAGIMGVLSIAGGAQISIQSYAVGTQRAMARGPTRNIQEHNLSCFYVKQYLHLGEIATHYFPRRCCSSEFHHEFPTSLTPIQISKSESVAAHGASEGLLATSSLNCFTRSIKLNTVDSCGATREAFTVAPLYAKL